MWESLFRTSVRLSANGWSAPLRQTDVAITDVVTSICHTDEHQLPDHGKRIMESLRGVQHSGQAIFLSARRPPYHGNRRANCGNPARFHRLQREAGPS
jgi:hypothetical protein